MKKFLTNTLHKAKIKYTFFPSVRQDFPKGILYFAHKLSNLSVYNTRVNLAQMSKIFLQKTTKYDFSFTHVTIITEKRKEYNFEKIKMGIWGKFRIINQKIKDHNKLCENFLDCFADSEVLRDNLTLLFPHANNEENKYGIDVLCKHGFYKAAYQNSCSRTESIIQKCK